MKKLIFLYLLALPFLTKGQDRAKLLAHWQDTTLVGSTIYNNTYNEIWGLAYNNREYAIIASTDGTHFIDVTDVNNISEVAFVAGAVQGGIIVHRDYHDYNGYLYAVADEGNSSLQIIDYTGLPNTVNVVYDSNVLIRRSHNIFIDSAKAKLYSFSNTTPNAFFPTSIYDLTNPTAPTLLKHYTGFGGVSISTVHDGFVRNDTAYLNCGSDGLQVVDFSDIVNPPLLGTMATYPGQGFNHSGWLDDRGDYYYLADENHEKPIKVVKSNDLSDLQVITSMDAGATHGFSIPHNLIYHDNFLYVSYYYDGLQVYDVSVPNMPVRTYYYDTYPGVDRNSYEGAWGVYPFLPSGNVLVSDMQTGLYVFEMTNATKTSSVKMDVETRIFPQPFQHHLTLALNSSLDQDEVNISIMDINGRIVADLGQHLIQNGENQLSLNIEKDLPNGIYILTIVGNHIKVSRKIAK